MDKLKRRYKRWIRWLLWIASCIAADFGFISDTGVKQMPVWIKDNPFYGKIKTSELRSMSGYIRLIMALLSMAAIYLLYYYITNRYSSFLWSAAGKGVLYDLRVFTLLIAVAFHIGFVGTVRRIRSISIYNETRRQTLESLLLTGIRPAELVVSMMTGPYAAGFIFAIIGLPIYIQMIAGGIAEPQDILGLYLFLFFIIQVPLYNVQLTGNTNDTAKPSFTSLKLIKADQQRNNAQQSTMLLVVFGMTMVFMGLFMVRTKWLLDLVTISPAISSISISRGGFNWIRYYYNVMIDPCTFFQMHIPLILLILPAFILLKIAAILGTAANIRAYPEPSALKKTPIYKRYVYVSSLAALITFFVVIGITWRPWFILGDYGTLLGNNISSLQYNISGFSLVMCFVAGIVLALQCWQVQPADKLTGAIRSLSYFSAYIGKRLKRTIIFFLALYLVICLFGWVPPFNILQIKSCAVLCLYAAVLFAHYFVCLIIYRVLFNRSKLYAIVVPFLLLIVNIAVLTAYFFINADQFRFLSVFSPFVPGYILYQYLHTAFVPQPVIADNSITIQTVLFTIGLSLLPVVLTVFSFAAYNKSTSLLPGKQTGGQFIKHKTAAQKFYEVIPFETKLLNRIGSIFDNPIFIYQFRSNLRQTDTKAWFIGLMLMYVFVSVITHYFGALINFFALFSFINFFHSSLYLNNNTNQDFADLSTVLFTVQLYYFGFRYPYIGESMIEPERINGTLGFLFVTPMKEMQIGFGKIFGYLMANSYLGISLGIGALLASLYAADAVGLGAALVTWATGQILVLSIVVLSLCIGGIMSTFPLIIKILRGVSVLIMLVIYTLTCIAIACYVDTQADMATWLSLTIKVWLGIAIFVALSAVLMWGFIMRLRAMRNSDLLSSDSYPV